MQPSTFEERARARQRRRRAARERELRQDELWERYGVCGVFLACWAAMWLGGRIALALGAI